MWTYIWQYVSSCENCAKIKNITHKPYGLLQPLDIPNCPWQSIAMDFIVKLPPSHGYDSIWVVCNHMTQAAHFIPIRESMDALELSHLYLDQVFHHHRFSQAIVSDRGSIFISSFFTELMKICGTKMKPSTAFHPQTDGLTKQTNQTLETYLCTYCSYQQDNWVDYLALAEFIFNNTLNTSTQQTPFFANVGYHPNFNITITKRSTNSSAVELTTWLLIICEELQAELNHSNEYMSKYYNQHHLPAPKFSPGDNVQLLCRNIKTTQPLEKLDYKKIGPYEVIKKWGKSSYLLKLPSSMKCLHLVFHVSLLEPFYPSVSIPNWIQDQPTTQVLLSPKITNPEVSTVLDSREIGRWYKYLIHWKNLPSSEDSWTPFMEVSTSLYPYLEQFHCRNPTRPHPPCFQITNVPSTPISLPTLSVTSINNYDTACTWTPPPEPWSQT